MVRTGVERMDSTLQINGRAVGPGHPTYVIAELSANHGNSFELAADTVRAAHDVGADAIKVQTYTADTLTIDCANEWFTIKGGTLWDGRTLYDLYGEACMPWEWQPELQQLAGELGIDFFSTAYDLSSFEFLEQLSVPVHKVASFENVDIPLVEAMAASGKPMIVSTGMASLEEIEDVVGAVRSAGNEQLALLKCTSAYPAPVDSMNLRSIPDLRERFGTVVGLSDHTMGATVAVAAVSLGASIVEKHFTLSRDNPGPDSAFSMEPDEFRAMVEAIRTAEQALGSPTYGTNEREHSSRVFRRSLFVVADVARGEEFTADNVRSIRPGHGMAPKHYREVIGRRAARDVAAGTPLSWELVEESAS